MSTAQAVVFCVTVVCATVGFTLIALGSMGVFDRNTEPAQQPAQNVQDAPAEHEEGDYEPPVSQEREEPLPIIPDNPPRMTTYVLKDPSRERRKCTCHDREIADEQKVLLWPLPGGAYYVLCDKGAPQAFANDAAAEEA